MAGAVDELIAEHGGAGHKDQGGGQGNGDALGEDIPHIRADEKLHGDKGGKAHHGGKAAGGDGTGGTEHRLGHGLLRVEALPAEFLEPLQQEDGVIHGAGQLENRPGGIGDEADLPKNQVGAHVDENRHPHVEHKKHRLKPGGSGEEKDQKDQGNDDAHHLHHVRAGGEVGVHRLHRGPAHGVIRADDFPDGPDGLNLVFLPHHQGIEGVAVFVPILHLLFILGLQGDGEVRLVVQPIDVVHAGESLQPGLVGQTLRDGDVLYHHPDVGHRLVIGGVHYIQTYRGGGLGRQVIHNVVVNFNQRGDDGAEGGKAEEKGHHQPPQLQYPFYSSFQNKITPKHQ